MAEIGGVEIFRSEIWNGDKYTEAHLDQLVVSFGRVSWTTLFGSSSLPMSTI